MIVDVVVREERCWRFSCWHCARALRADSAHDCRGACEYCRMMSGQIIGVTVNGSTLRGAAADDLHEEAMDRYCDEMYERMDEPDGLEWDLTP